MRGGSGSPRSFFERYANLEISLSELRASQGSALQFNREGVNYTLGPSPAVEPPIPIRPEHLSRALEAFVAGSITAEALQEWANLLILSDAYAIGPADERDQVTALLHEIASPELYGELTEERLREISTILLGAVGRKRER